MKHSRWAFIRPLSHDYGNQEKEKTMKLFALTGFLCLAVAGLAQDVHFDYDRTANFTAYRTYQWVDAKTLPGQPSDQLIDHDIKRAVDEQLAGQGLQRVDRGGDLQVAYHVALDREKQFNGFTMGPRWDGFGQVTTSTIAIGMLVVDMFDPARNQLVWRGDAERTLDIKKDPDKNYRNLEKAMTKLFKNYPPRIGQK
jgi:hypothetical protein